MKRLHARVRTTAGHTVHAEIGVVQSVGAASFYVSLHTHTASSGVEGAMPNQAKLYGKLSVPLCVYRVRFISRSFAGSFVRSFVHSLALLFLSIQFD